MTNKLIGHLLLGRKMPKISCPVVYCIANLANGKEYIGATTDFKNRITTHRSGLSAGHHKSHMLQAEFSHHGIDAFAVSILEYTDEANLYNREVAHIQKRLPAYNINSTAPINIIPLRKFITKEEQKELYQLRNDIWGFSEGVALRLGIKRSTLSRILSPKARYINRDRIELIKKELKTLKEKSSAA